VDHEPQAGVAAATLEPSSDVRWQDDPFARDRVDRLAGAEQVRAFEPLDARHGAVVGLLGHRDRLGCARHDADLVAQVEVDRCGTDLLGTERVDDEAPGGDLAQDHVAREDHARRV
jgi:hypothetical protein